MERKKKEPIFISHRRCKYRYLATDVTVTAKIEKISWWWYSLKAKRCQINLIHNYQKKPHNFSFSLQYGHSSPDLIHLKVASIEVNIEVNTVTAPMSFSTWHHRKDSSGCFFTSLELPGLIFFLYVLLNPNSNCEKQLRVRSPSVLISSQMWIPLLGFAAASVSQQRLAYKDISMCIKLGKHLGIAYYYFPIHPV